MGLKIGKWKLQGRPQFEISLTYPAPESESGKVLGILHSVTANRWRSHQKVTHSALGTCVRGPSGPAQCSGIGGAGA